MLCCHIISAGVEMIEMKRFLRASVLYYVSALCVANTALAQDTANEHATETFGAHVHGHAIVTLVLEGNEMQLAFQAAAESIVGFEHKPATSEQRAEVDSAMAVFSQGNWFSFNAEASCEIVAADANSDLVQPKFHGGHADFYANYQLLCQRPARLDQLQLSVFELVPTLQNVDVQWIINGRQGATNTTLADAVVQF